VKQSTAMWAGWSVSVAASGGLMGFDKKKENAGGLQFGREGGWKGRGSGGDGEGREGGGCCKHWKDRQD